MALKIKLDRLHVQVQTSGISFQFFKIRQVKTSIRPTSRDASMDIHAADCHKYSIF